MRASSTRRPRPGVPSAGAATHHGRPSARPAPHAARHRCPDRRRAPCARGVSARAAAARAPRGAVRRHRGLRHVDGGPPCGRRAAQLVDGAAAGLRHRALADLVARVAAVAHVGDGAPCPAPRTQDRHPWCADRRGARAARSRGLPVRGRRAVPAPARRLRHRRGQRRQPATGAASHPELRARAAAARHRALDRDPAGPRAGPARGLRRAGRHARHDRRRSRIPSRARRPACAAPCPGSAATWRWWPS